MCGIVGLISKRANGFMNGEVSAFTDMLTLDQIRGPDSTGAFTVYHNRQVKSIKIGSHPADLMVTSGWQPFITSVGVSGRLVIGHNRKATHGGVTSRNAHPFHSEHIHLVHNGMIYNHKSLSKEIEEEDVDSHNVCKALAAHGPHEVLPKLSGAFAFVWYDRKQEKLFLIRNTQRPLGILETDDLFAIASEPWMALGALSRNNISVKDVKGEALKPGELVSFNLRGERASEGTIDLDSHTTTTYYSSFTHHSTSDYRYREQNGVWRPADKSTKDEVDGLDDDDISGLGASKAVAAATPEPTFKKGTVVLFRVVKVEFNPQLTHKPKVYGKICAPGMPTTDCCGYIDEMDETWAKARGKIGTAIVRDCVGSVCGLSVWIESLLLEEPIIETYNKQNLTKTEWEFVVEECECDKCGCALDLDLNIVTSVNRRGTTYRCVCPDCIGKTLKGKMKDEFESSVDLALQNSISLHKKSTKIPYLLTQEAGSQSIH
ncbi:MAG: class II glutamine amidotransferase [Pseudomonadota bacterium]|nr:class II glutamine amidotransferase [Pseudomonadota bacterium]